MIGVLADQLQVWGFERDFLVFSDGSLGFGLEAKPVDITCFSEEATNDFAVQISSFLNSLPSHLDIQFVQDIGSGNDRVLTEHEELAAKAEDPLSRSLAQQRIQILKALESKGEIPKHTLKIFIRKKSPTAFFDKPRVFSKASQFQAIAEERFSREIQSLEVLIDEIKGALQTLGVKTEILSSEQIYELMYWQWNPDRPVPPGSYDVDNVRGSVVFTDALLYERGFSFLDVHHRLVSIKKLPDQTFAGMAQALRNLPFASRLFLTIHVPDQQKEMESLQTQRRLAFSMARGKHSGVSDLESEAKLKDVETLLDDLISQGEKVFHVSLQVLLRSTEKDDLRDQVGQVLSCIRELSGAEGMEESLASFDMFCNLAIPNARSPERAKRLKTSNLADLIPIYGPWTGFDKPSVLLRSRMGGFVKFDPFDPSLTNYNHIVSGGSGSGKSFFTTNFLLQMRKENPKVFIVDIGGSYKKLCETLSGQYIDLGVNSQLSVNPFDLQGVDKEPSHEKIKFLVGLIEMMTKEEHSSHIGRLERAELEDAIRRVYEKQNWSLSTLREILLSHQDSQIKKLGRILGPWCGNTPFGSFVDRPTTIHLNRPIVCFDLKGLDALPDLQAVCLYIITDFIWREIQRDKSVAKFLVFDECWKLLENEAGSVFIGEVFRTFRKYNAGAIAISQNLDDFAKSRVSTAILSNSAIKWILLQRGADQGRLKEVLQLNDNELALIQSLKQERGKYSEAFLMAGDQRSVIAVESTPLEYWIATTDARDLNVIESECLQKPELDRLQILKQLSERFPNGVAAAAVNSQGDES